MQVEEHEASKPHIKILFYSTKTSKCKNVHLNRVLCTLQRSLFPA